MSLLSVAAEVTSPAEGKDARKLLQEGLFEEEASRDLTKAAAAYQAAITRYGEERVFAATALFRLAEIRAKEGKTAEAVALLQRIVTEFADQPALLEDTRKRLSALGERPSPAAELPGDQAGELRKKLTALQVEAAALSATFRPNHPSLKRVNEQIAAIEGILRTGVGVAPTAKEAEELELIREMVKNSPDLINARDNAGIVPLARAAANGWVAVATYLLDHGARLEDPARPPGENPLQMAAHAGHKRMTELFLARGADVDAGLETGSSALHVALQERRHEIVRLLLEKGAKLNPTFKDSPDPRKVDHTTPLLTAVEQGDATMTKLLIEKGAKVELGRPFTGDRPLTSAAKGGNLPMMTLLLDAGADVNAPTKEGMTPLALVCERGREELAAFLLNRGAQPNLADSSGITPLHRATGTSARLVSLLLKAGASPRAVTNRGGTPWHSSIRVGKNQEVLGHDPSELPSAAGVPRPSVISRSTTRDTNASEITGELIEIWGLLQAAGADINAVDAAKLTPLHLAFAGKLSIEHLTWLLQHGADLNLRGTNIGTPLDLATFPLRMELERRFVFPKLAQERAVHLVMRQQSYKTPPERVQPVAEYDAAPRVGELLRHMFRVGAARTSGGFDLVIYRRDPEGGVKRAAEVAIQQDAKTAPLLPTLDWGDVVVLDDGNSRSRSVDDGAWVLEWVDENAPEPRTVKISVGDRTQQFGSRDLAGEELWSPSEGLPAEWRIGDLLERVVRGEPRAQITAVKLQRTAGGKLQEWIFNAQAQRIEARLADGDHLIVPLLPAQPSLAERRRHLYRAAPGRVFVEPIFTASPAQERPNTLAELLMQSYLTSRMVVPQPDLARIVIHRLKGDAGEEEKIAVDLRRAISSLTAQTTAEQARQLDVPLQWGDVVEIPQLTEARLTNWTGFDPATVRFLSRALSREVKAHLNGEEMQFAQGNDNANQLVPRFTVFAYNQRGSWSAEPPDTLPPLTAAQLFEKPPLQRFWPDRIVRVAIRASGQVERQFDAKALQETPPWLFPGDHVFIETLDDAVK
ncbi:MAG TPA: ankyrin repeat domain-containing protein [Chthoniobacteraceae bacterium]|jgi:ankyrin repeat protein